MQLHPSFTVDQMLLLPYPCLVSLLAFHLSGRRSLPPPHPPTPLTSARGLGSRACETWFVAGQTKRIFACL